MKCRKQGSPDDRGRATFQRAECYRDDLDPTFRTYFEGRVGVHITGGTFVNRHPVLFGDVDTGDERFKIVKTEGFLMNRIHPLVDVGGGIGFNVFTGDGFTFAKFLTTPVSVVVAPLAALDPAKPKLRFFKIRYEINYMPFGLDGDEDFEYPSSYHMDTEWTSRVGLQFDFFAFGRQ
jgi:hypothetical protein